MSKAGVTLKLRASYIFLAGSFFPRYSLPRAMPATIRRFWDLWSENSGNGNKCFDFDSILLVAMAVIFIGKGNYLSKPRAR